MKVKLDSRISARPCSEHVSQLGSTIHFTFVWVIFSQLDKTHWTDQLLQGSTYFSTAYREGPGGRLVANPTAALKVWGSLHRQGIHWDPWLRGEARRFFFFFFLSSSDPRRQGKARAARQGQGSPAPASGAMPSSVWARLHSLRVSMPS